VKAFTVARLDWGDADVVARATEPSRSQGLKITGRGLMMTFELTARAIPFDHIDEHPFSFRSLVQSLLASRWLGALTAAGLCALVVVAG
jgi:hypothetical protein